MFPDGKVGVDPVCVLGLNQNKGQKILLRLRTDDLLGFRKYLRCGAAGGPDDEMADWTDPSSCVDGCSIKKVLFHELSHNVRFCACS